MLWKVLPAAVLAAVFGATSVSAQAGGGLSGPAEMPPSGYKGQQYVDSRGCVFLRAGYGGQVTWVPRVSRDRRQLCGYPPSGRDVAVAEPAQRAAPAPAPAPQVTTRRPLDTIASTTTPPTIREVPRKPTPPEVVEAYRPAPVVMPKAAAKPAPKVAAAAPVVRSAPAAPAPVAVPTRRVAAPQGETVAEVPSAGGARLACPASAPVAKRFAMHGGGSKVMCVGADGSFENATLPRLVSGSLAGLPTGYDAHVAAGTPQRVAGAGGTASRSTKSAKLPGQIPPGYKPAWTDDRLNPNRGKQTVQGVVDQDEVWTRTVPSELREDSKVKRKRLVVVVRPSSKGEAQADVVASSKSVAKQKVVPAGQAAKAKAQPKAAGKGALVQVGAFGVAGNADAAAQRLQSLGLPVVQSKVKRGGKELRVVYAGPFADAGSAQAALRAARSAGFGDAILR